MRIVTKNIKAALLAIVLFMLMQNSRAQVIQEVQNSFNLYKQTALLEKIYVHTDKSVYLPGEILWFKVYCVDGNDHKPLNLSKVVYVDILDNSQNRIVEAKVAMKNGSGDGSLYIPVSVSNGNYKLRAYTSWMKNFSPDFYFEKQITFVNPLKSPDVVVKETAPAYDINFFPEGGNLVAGIKSTVGFKAVAQNGEGADIHGVIVDQKNDTIAGFKSLKFGMGSFSFTPAQGGAYRAVIVIGANPPITKDLPQVNNQGYVMSITDNGSGQVDVTVKNNENAGGNIYLFVHTRQSVKLALSANVNNVTAHFTINKSDLGEGISHFTVFNTAKQPVCERLYFKRPANQLSIAAGADAQQYGMRKKVSVAVLAKDHSGNATNADMSMSVYRVDSLQAMEHSNIFSYLWLSSDLRGNIESPDYYFTNANAESDEALDNLMLTQGWRRFHWSDLLENRPASFSFLPEYTGHIISAKIVNAENGAPAKNIMTYLGIPGKRVQLYTSQSDSLGRLLYETKDFYGTGEVIAQTNELVDSTYRIDVISPFSEQYSKTTLPKFEFNTAGSNALKDHSIGIQVLNIYAGNLIKRYYDPQVDSTAFYGTPFKTYKLDDFTRFTTMEEDLREYVSEDNIVKTRGYFHIKVLNNKGFLDSDPLVLLDGIPVFNMNKVFTVDPLKVRKLEVVPFRYYYGPSTEEGIFSFTTYKGDLGGVELDPRAVVIDYEGLQLKREFYSPTYDTDAKLATRLPDFRNLLYWTPSVKQQGADAASFYTSDEPGTYVGVVQGITPNGDAGSSYFTFEVK
jgi:hypothetical protein